MLDILQGVTMYAVRYSDWFTLVGYAKKLAFGWIKTHQPSLLPLLKSVEVFLEINAILGTSYIMI